MSNAAEFTGAKIALFLGARLVVIRRDAHAGLEWPGYLDLPGGGREVSETPEACVIREVREELGLILFSGNLSSRRYYRAPHAAWFFAAHLPEERVLDIVFGSEGQGWQLISPEAFIAAPDAIPHFRDRVRDYLQAAGPDRAEP